MNFDEEFKQNARASVAIKRLRDIRQELQENQQARDDKRDMRLRGGSLVIIAAIVGFAIYQL